MRAFISYSRRDEELTDEVCRELEARHHEVWRDVGSIPGGDDWRGSIEKGIADSDVFVLLMSPAVAERPANAREELGVACLHDKAIIPVYLAAVAELPSGFNLTLAGRQRIDLFPSFHAGMERLLKQLGDGGVAVEAEPRRLEVRTWAADRVGRMRKTAHGLRLEAKQRDLGKKALKVGGFLAAGAVAVVAASAKTRATVEAEADTQRTEDAEVMLAAYRRKINDIIERCVTEMGRLLASENPESAYEREYRPALRYALGQLDATEPPTGQVPEHRRLVESLGQALDHLDRAIQELQRGDSAGARRELERMAEQFLRTIQKYGELLSS